jgi:tetratricopeptide (TPR) repeat protein
MWESSQISRRTPHPRNLARAGLVTLFLAALLLVYSNHFDNAFHFDDSHTIVSNSYITSIGNLPLFFQDARTFSSLPSNQVYRPVITSLNAIDYWIAGELDSRVFHWHIFLEFLVFLYLMYFVLLRVFTIANGQPHRLVSFIGVAFFAFHTATAETINYIIARSDGFSTLMVLAGFLLFTHNTGWRRQLGLIPFAIGMLAKPTTLMLAPILALYSLALESPSITVSCEKTTWSIAILRAVRSTWPYFLVGMALFLLMESMTPDTWSPGGRSALHYLMTQPFVIWVYVKAFLLPTGLSADTDLQPIQEWLSAKVFWGMLVVLLMLLVAALASRARATLPIAFGILWFFIALVPTSSVIPLAEVMNHHRTFFPYIGLVMALAWAGYLAYQKLVTRVPAKTLRWATTALVATVLALHGWGTYQRNVVWDSGLSLWYDVTIKSPGNGRGLMNYGLALMEVGRLEEAIEYFEKALDTNYGQHPYLHTNLGIAHNALGRRTGSELLKKRAEEYFKAAVVLGPGYPQTYFRYAQWLHEHGRSQEALPLVRKAVELAPGEPGAQKLLDDLTMDTETRLQQQRLHAERLGTAAAFIDLSLAYYQAQDFASTIAAAQSALAIDPDSALAYNNICSGYNRLAQYDLAIKACEQALELDPGYELARNNLAWARRQRGN